MIMTLKESQNIVIYSPPYCRNKQKKLILFTTFFHPFSAVWSYHEETYHDFFSESETQECELNALQCPKTKNVQ